ncbi:hypothetical protein BDL97_18G059000 [Sphagnum fallax]|nr:hypothetical protein BDL97_18G059000 [Sphagnum fallax]KAH8933961.1 hypothetical protein BDL97_18G059000 [Sphagnum fallax]
MANSTTAVAAAAVSETIRTQPTFHLLLVCPSGISRAQLEVDFSPVYDREPHPDLDLEKRIEMTWEQRVAKQPSLYNGTKFRYGGYNRAKAGEGMTVSSETVCLHLGLTDYKTFLGTNLSAEWDRFLVPVPEDVDRCKHTASPLGNGAIVETVDRHVLVLQRSSNVGEFPGHLVFPGGHSEPQEVGIEGHIGDNVEFDKNEINQRIALEMFEGLIREVVEETGVPATCLCEPLFIGISQRLINVRPTAFFYVKCTISSSQVQEFYQCATDGFESTHLLAIPKAELLTEANKMPGCHQGGAVLYDLMTKFA